MIAPDVDAAQLAVIGVVALDGAWPAAARLELAEIVSAAAARAGETFWSGFAESAARHLRGEVKPS